MASGEPLGLGAPAQTEADASSSGTAWEGLTPPYATIVADPPWHYDERVIEYGRGAARSAPMPYSTMTNDEIAGRGMTQQLSLLDPVDSQVRRTDHRTAKRAAAMNPEGRATQAARILRRLWTTGGTITADEAWRDLTRHGEDVTRGEWSARLGVLCSPKRGLLEPAGEVEDLDRRGRPRMVLAYRLTPAGEREVALMFGGVS